MDLSSIAGSIALRQGQPLRLNHVGGRRICVLEGDVWITQDRDPRDAVLGAGDEYAFNRPGAVVMALDGDARIAHEDGVVVGAGGSRGRNRFLAVLSRLWTGWHDARRAAQARTSLDNLSDHLLADIGLQRAGCGFRRYD